MLTNSRIPLLSLIACSALCLIAPLAAQKRSTQASPSAGTHSAGTRTTTVWIGSTAKAPEGGIYRADLDLESGKLSDLTQVASLPGTGFLVRHPKKPWLFATASFEDTHPESAVAAFAIGEDQSLREIGHHKCGGNGACFVALDARQRGILVANYGSGSVAILPLDKDGQLQPARARKHEGKSKHPRRQLTAHAHAIRSSRDGKFAYACDLGTDEVWIYRIDDQGLELEGRRNLPAGSGPRHLCIAPNDRTVYVLNELTLTVATMERDRETGMLGEPTITNLLTGDDKVEDRTAIEIALHPELPYVYCAIRDLANKDRDSIVTLRLNEKGKPSRVGSVPTGLSIPRHFALDSKGDWLLCCGQQSDRVGVFRINRESGTPEATDHGVRVPMPMCVAIERR